jgi:hypothetical protein
MGYCRSADGGPCIEAGVQHLNEPIVPNPNKPKDAITHKLFWRRLGAFVIPLHKSTQAKSLSLGFKG